VPVASCELWSSRICASSLSCAKRQLGLMMRLGAFSVFSLRLFVALFSDFMMRFSTSPRKMGRTLVFMAETGAFQFGSRVRESVRISDSFNVCLSLCLHSDYSRFGIYFSRDS
jgi:hypothetical protein